MNLEKRIQQIEEQHLAIMRQNRRMRIGMTVMALFMAGALFVAASEPFRTEMIEIVNANGEGRAWMGVGEDGGGYVAVTDRNGNSALLTAAGIEHIAADGSASAGSTDSTGPTSPTGSTSPGIVCSDKEIVCKDDKGEYCYYGPICPSDSGSAGSEPTGEITCAPLQLVCADDMGRPYCYDGPYCPCPGGQLMCKDRMTGTVFCADICPK